MVCCRGTGCFEGFSMHRRDFVRGGLTLAGLGWLDQAWLAGADGPQGVEKDGVTRVRLLPPTPGKNPRNSEGAFISLKDGRLLFVYTHFTGGGGDHSAAHLAARSSRDGGRTWTDTDELVLANEAKMNIMSVSLLRLPSG